MSNDLNRKAASFVTHRGTATCLATLSILAFCALAPMGCGQKPKLAVRSSGEYYIEYYVDTSGSDRNAVPTHVRLICKVSQVCPDGTFVTVLRCDTVLETIKLDFAGRNGQRLRGELNARLRPLAAGPGSRIDLVVADMLQKAQMSTKPIVFVIGSDFMATGLTEVRIHAFKANVAALSKLPQCKAIILVGASPAASAFIDATLAPLAQGKLVRLNVESATAQQIVGALR